ncbi:Uncharacterized membrane protein YccC [Belnapia rosea]|nr:Uncharacterized membrane protein YccC [Belnapia rosea]
MVDWLPGRREWLFSLVTFAAAVLALFIAFGTGLERPYWAATTVYITAQGSAGALRAKGIWRLCGTFVGAAFAVLAVPNLVNAPPLLVLAMAIWVGGCLAAALLDQTPRSYGFMLAGYTAGIIGFPSVDAPDAIFTTALLRVEEISLGIACAWALHAILLPRPATPQLLRRLEAWTADVARLAGDALSGGVPSLAEDRRRLARDGTALDAMFQQARYEDGGRATLRWLPVLRAEARRMPVLASAAGDRVAALQAADPAALARIEPLLREVAAAIGAQVTPEAVQALDARLAAAERDAAAEGGWPGLLREGLMDRLRELLSTWAACRAHAGRILAQDSGSYAGPSPEAGLRLPGHADLLLVGLSGLAAGLSVITCCAFWILAGWPDGATAAMMAAVGASLFAQLDDPAPAIFRFMQGTLIAVAVAGITLFAILPMVDGFVPLVIVLGLLYLPIGALFAVPSLTPRMAPIAINGFALLALQSTYGAEFAGFIEGGIAMMVGFGTALTVTRLVRGAGVAWRVDRLVQADRRDLVRLAEGRRPADLRRIAAAMLDRFEALAARLGAADASAMGQRELAELRAAFNLLRLRRAAPVLAEATQRAVEDAIGATAGLVRGSLAPEAALARIDAALFAALPEPSARPAALALSGLRMALFPRAAPPSLLPPPPAALAA